MKPIKIFKLSCLFLFALITAQSCMVSSLHPLYTNVTMVHNDNLIGRWVDKDSCVYEVSIALDSVKTTDLSKEERFMQGLSTETKNPNFKTTDRQKKSIKKLYNNLEKNILTKEERFMQGLSTETNIKSKDIEDEEIKKSIQKIEKNYNAEFTIAINKKYYNIKLITEKDTTFLQGHLAKLGDYYFLDIMLDEDMLEKRIGNYSIYALVAPTHGFMKIQFLDDGKIKLNSMDIDSFRTIKKEKKIRIKSIKRNSREIITAKTSDIQKFLIKFADSELFNNEESELILTPLK